ncbi:heat shock 70 kDa protein 12A-like [Mya arenaria]|nr:heat shock 70 kDa protein 12A-like [Mya arenaria]XP_052818221.1 heat shock 70 kDa protein 12A-like [Mya arenaria]XP_052818223.1 heat shock 70 kDa protein 12A-like [Mya arenaria]XP_052818224.1 heat shock 70 kDa protein 12A-like [Mya arenaria]XP_052818225.1 heat shock 70 kDa protein 12A-like [Mya arenaria]
MATAKVADSSRKLLKDAFPTPAKPEKEHLIVAAIDFGTTFTGYAFSMKKPFEDPISCSIFETEGLRSEKGPSCVLLNPDETFNAFGYEAERNYEELCDTKTDGYYFFKRFKMSLYKTKKLSRETKIKDLNGKELPAIDVFSKVIKHISEDLYQKLGKKTTGVSPDDVLWVITIPAIWSDAAKQFMREAANKAEIEDEHLKLILEPEAASLFCNMQKSCKIVKVDDTVAMEPFPVGQKYIVADLGGGTADLAVHEILEDRNLREIARSDGDAYGGILVDEAFQEFISDFFERNVVQHLLETKPEEYIDILKSFEVKKRAFQSNTPSIVLKMPFAFKDAFEDCEVSYDDAIREANEKYAGKAEYMRNGKLKLSADIMKGFFDKAVDGVVKFIQQMRSNDELGMINTVLMVGGFSESKYVQERIENEIPGVRLVIPTDPSLAVLKGAVLYGKNPRAITERIARFSYGFSVAKPFEEGIDPEELKIIRNGREYCNDAFKKLITRGEILKRGDAFGDIIGHMVDADNLFALMLSSLLPVVSKVYKSTKEDPMYTTEEEECEEIGNLIIPSPPTGWPPVSALVHGIIVGESELHSFACDVKSMKIYEAKFDCL